MLQICQAAVLKGGALQGALLPAGIAKGGGGSAVELAAGSGKCPGCSSDGLGPPWYTFSQAGQAALPWASRFVAGGGFGAILSRNRAKYTDQTDR